MRTIVLNGNGLKPRDKAKKFGNLYELQFASENDLKVHSPKIWSSIKNDPDFPFALDNLLAVIACDLIDEKEMEAFLSLVQENSTLSSIFWKIIVGRILSAEYDFQYGFQELPLLLPQRTTEKALSEMVRVIREYAAKKLQSLALYKVRDSEEENQSKSFRTLLFGRFAKIFEQASGDELLLLSQADSDVAKLVFKNERLAQKLAKSLTQEKIWEWLQNCVGEVFRETLAYLAKYKKMELLAVCTNEKNKEDYVTFAQFVGNFFVKENCNLISSHLDLTAALIGSWDLQQFQQLLDLSDQPLTFLNTLLKNKEITHKIFSHVRDLFAFIVAERMTNQKEIDRFLGLTVCESISLKIHVGTELQLAMMELKKAGSLNNEDARLFFTCFEHPFLRTLVKFSPEDLLWLLSTKYGSFFSRVIAGDDTLWKIFVTEIKDENSRNGYFAKFPWLQGRYALDNNTAINLADAQIVKDDTPSFFTFLRLGGNAFPINKKIESFSDESAWLIVNTPKLWEKIKTFCNKQGVKVEDLNGLFRLKKDHESQAPQMDFKQYFSSEVFWSFERRSMLYQFLSTTEIMDKLFTQSQENGEVLNASYYPVNKGCMDDPYLVKKILLGLHKVDISQFRSLLIVLNVANQLRDENLSDLLLDKRCSSKAQEILFVFLQDRPELVLALIQSNNVNYLTNLSRSSIFLRLLGDLGANRMLNKHDVSLIMQKVVPTGEQNVVSEVVPKILDHRPELIRELLVLLSRTSRSEDVEYLLTIAKQYKFADLTIEEIVAFHELENNQYHEKLKKPENLLELMRLAEVANFKAYILSIFEHRTDLHLALREMFKTIQDKPAKDIMEKFASQFFTQYAGNVEDEITLFLLHEQWKEKASSNPSEEIQKDSQAPKIETVENIVAQVVQADISEPASVENSDAKVNGVNSTFSENSFALILNHISNRATIIIPPEMPLDNGNLQHNTDVENHSESSSVATDASQSSEIIEPKTIENEATIQLGM